MSQGIKFQERRALTPYMGDRRASLYVALSIVIMAYASHFGPVSILVFYAVWLTQLYRNGTPAIKLTKRTALPLIFASWCCLSAFWSTYPFKTLYSALEFTSLIVCALIIAERVRVGAFLRGIIYGSAVTLVASLYFGRYTIDPFSGNSSLVGLFGSKNVVGLFAEMLVLATVIAWPNIKGITGKLFFCIMPSVLGLACLHLSKSATSVLSLIGTLAFVGVIYGVTRMPRSARWIAFAMASVWLIGLVTVGLMFDWDKDILKSFGKSSNLTGRTYLWDKGIQYGMESPFIGHGFAAFWVKGHLPAEHLWYKFGIFGKVGFHFHNLAINTFVEIGLVGVLLIVLQLILALFKSIALTLRHKMNPNYILCLGFTTMFSIRAFTEVDIVGTFAVGGLLFFSLAPRLTIPRSDRHISSESPVKYQNGNMSAILLAAKKGHGDMTQTHHSQSPSK